MCLGALVHAGVPLNYLVETLEKLGISEEYKLWADLVQRNGQQATKVFVELVSGSHSHPHPSDHPPHPVHSSDHAHSNHAADSHAAAHSSDSSPDSSADFNHSHSHSPARNLPQIEALIRSAHLPPRTEAWSLAVFRRLAEAEAAVHGIPPEQVHFHEVGATDAIVDIVGTCAGLDWLGVDGIYCSALPIGGGTVWAAHGRLPVPAPAVLKLWEMRQVPVYSNGIDRELVTPTGAALVTTLADRFGAPPPMILQKVGLGAGSRDLPIPNILRLWVGTSDNAETGRIAQVVDRSLHQGSTHHQDFTHHQGSTYQEPDHPLGQQETVTVLETQIDDLTPQAIGYVMEQLLQAGALDVFTQPVGMKKSRPGLLLTVICRPEQTADCEAIVFQETTTLGIRRSQQARTALHREIETVTTVHGAVRVKVARLASGAVANVQPEYEDCVQIARQTQQPWREIHRLALASWYKLSSVH